MGNFKSNIIALCGYKRSGKDFATSHIVDKYDYTHYKFAHKLKQLMRVLFNFDDEQIEGEKKEIIDLNWGITPRHAMQYIGTDIFQNHMNGLIPGIDKTFWVKSFVNDVKKKAPHNIVISDMRFPHEYECIKSQLNSYKLTVIKIINDNNPNVDVHVSETAYNEIPYDFEIHNNYNEDFIKDIDDIMVGIQS